MFELTQLTTYQAGVLQSRAYRELKITMKNILSPHGLTMMQWAVLGYVANSGRNGERVSSLAKELGSTQAFITNTINSLEEKGYVGRRGDKVDSRAKVVHLKPGKQRLVNRIELEVRAAMRRELYNRLTPDELRTYVLVLKKLAGS